MSPPDSLFHNYYFDIPDPFKPGDIVESKDIFGNKTIWVVGESKGNEIVDLDYVAEFDYDGVYHFEPNGTIADASIRVMSLITSESYRTTELLSIEGNAIEYRRFLPSTELRYIENYKRVPESLKYLSMYHKGEIELRLLIEFQNMCKLKHVLESDDMLCANVWSSQIKLQEEKQESENARENK
jgi:hypothetical protein